ncbi:MAG: PAS domain S-box protein [Deltaproteobacteria bacterium]|nr:PAS domain S-box protein [Deltaproteobacteria bacterium]
MSKKPSYEELEIKISKLEDNARRGGRILEACRTIVESTNDSIFLVDRKGRYLLSNQSHNSALGLTASKIRGKYYSEFHSPETSREFQNNIEKVFETGMSLQYEYSTGQDERCFLQTLSPVKALGPEKDITSVSVIEKEITDRKNMETALRLIEEKTHDLLENIIDPYYEMDLLGNYTYLNEAAKRNMTGSPNFTLVSRNSSEFTNADDINRVIPIFYEVYETGKPKTGVEVSFAADSGIRNLEISISPIKDSQGNVVGFRGISRDVTENKMMLENIRASEERYRSIIENIEEGYYEVDNNGIFTFFNNYAEKILGYLPIGVPYSKFMTEESAKRVFQAFNIVYQMEKPATGIVIEAVASDGRHINLNVSVSLIRDAKGKKTGFRGIINDVTERDSMAEELRRSEERYRSIIENIQDGYYEIDLSGAPLFCNDAYLKILGYNRDEWFSSHFTNYSDKESTDRLLAIFTDIFRSGKPASGIEWKLSKKDGFIRNIEETISLIKNAKGEPIGFRGLVRDVTERKNHETIIKQLAYHDFLTGLPNRLLFFDRFKLAMEAAKRKKQLLAVMEIDLDGFKAVNDSYGHHIGDLLLQEIADLLRGILRQSDTAARMGGDEFMLLLPEIKDIGDAELIAVKILRAFEKQFILERHIIYMTPSIGIAVFPEHGHDADTMIRHADIAMYQAKGKGKNSYQI